MSNFKIEVIHKTGNEPIIVFVCQKITDIEILMGTENFVLGIHGGRSLFQNIIIL